MERKKKDRRKDRWNESFIIGQVLYHPSVLFATSSKFFYTINCQNQAQFHGVFSCEIQYNLHTCTHVFCFQMRSVGATLIRGSKMCNAFYLVVSLIGCAASFVYLYVFSMNQPL